MGVKGLGRALLRRWYVTLTGLAVTAGLCAAVVILLPGSYQVKAEVALLPPQNATTPNPLLGFGDMAGVADLLSRAATDTAVADSIEAKVHGGSYSVLRDPTANGGLVQIIAKAPSAAGAEALAHDVDAMLPTTLLRLQTNASVASSAFITIQPVAFDPKATLNTKSTTRALIAVAVVGLIGTVQLVAFSERVAVRRRQRAAGIDPDAASDDYDGDPAPGTGVRSDRFQTAVDSRYERLPRTQPGAHRESAADSMRPTQSDLFPLPPNRSGRFEEADLEEFDLVQMNAEVFGISPITGDEGSSDYTVETHAANAGGVRPRTVRASANRRNKPNTQAGASRPGWVRRGRD